MKGILVNGYQNQEGIQTSQFYGLIYDLPSVLNSHCDAGQI